MAQQFFDMLRTANQEVFPSCENHSQLSILARILNIKTKHHFSYKFFNDFCQFLKEMLLVDNVILINFYNTKTLVQGLSLIVDKIDSCHNGCIIY